MIMLNVAATHDDRHDTVSDPHREGPQKGVFAGLIDHTTLTPLNPSVAALVNTGRGLDLLLSLTGVSMKKSAPKCSSYRSTSERARDGPIVNIKSRLHLYQDYKPHKLKERKTWEKHDLI